MTHIVLADDDDDMREHMEWVLKTDGYTVTAVADGEAVLDAMMVQTPDLILLDYMMPVMDGFATLKRLHRMKNTVPVIFMTARSDQHVTVQAIREGVRDFIPKPVNDQDLLFRVRVAIAHGPYVGTGSAHPEATNYVERLHNLTRQICGVHHIREAFEGAGSEGPRRALADAIQTLSVSGLPEIQCPGPFEGE